MSKKKHGIIWNTPTHILRDLVVANTTILGILKALGFMNPSGSYEPLKARLRQEGIDFSHIRLGREAARGKRTFKAKIPLEQILVQGSTFSPYHLKLRLLKEMNWPYKCAVCLLTGLWRDQPLTLQLDHINGVHTDNRFENLRLLCPNCHSQTSTFMGRNKFTNGPK